MNLTKSILIMDDDEDVRFLVEVMFAKLGYRVDASQNADQAIAKYQAALDLDQSYNAVILDLNIPGSIGGGEVAARILALDNSAKLFVSSGNENDPVMIDYAQYGFTGKLAKPFLYADAVELVKLID